MLTVCLFLPLFNFFLVPLNVLVRTPGVHIPQDGNHCFMIYGGLNDTDINWIETNKNQKCAATCIKVSLIHSHTEICADAVCRQADKLHNLCSV
jgi:hypothetical protein